MTTRARRTNRKGSAPAKGRRKGQPRRARKPASSAVRMRSRTNPEIPGSLVSRTRESLATPAESQLGGPPAIRDDQATEPEKPPESGLDFLWRVIRDEKAQDGLCRLMRNASANLLVVLTPVTVVAYVTMPVKSGLVKAIMTGIYVILIGAGTLVRFRPKKRRPGRLALVRGTADLNFLITAAQEAENRLCEPDGGRCENGGHARPARDAPAARQHHRGPRPCRSSHNPGFHPVGDQSQSTPAAFDTIRVGSGIRRGQRDSGLLVSAHPVCPIAPAGPGVRRLYDSANVPSPGGADPSRPSANIMCPTVTYCRHEVAWSLQDTLSRTRRRNVSQSRQGNVSVTFPESRVPRTVTRPSPAHTSTQLDSKQAEDLRHASAERSTSATVGSLLPRENRPAWTGPREPGRNRRLPGHL
jgi:hypothetical protein